MTRIKRKGTLLDLITLGLVLGSGSVAGFIGCILFIILLNIAILLIPALILWAIWNSVAPMADIPAAYQHANFWTVYLVILGARILFSMTNSK